MTHTPTPWRIDADERTLFGGPVVPGDESTGVRYICTLPFYEREPLRAESEANAAHIVRCVNSHDTLVEALRYVRQFYQDNFNIMPVAFQTVDSEIEKALTLIEK